MLDRQVGGVDPMALRHKPQQYTDRVPIVALGVATEIPIGDHMLQQKAADMGSQEMVFRHEPPPASAVHSVRSARRLRPAVRPSWSNRHSWRRR